MKLVHYYKENDLNFGVVEEIIDPGDGEGVLIQCSQVGTLDIACCFNFIPKVGDKVELFTDEDDGGWYLQLY